MHAIEELQGIISQALSDRKLTKTPVTLYEPIQYFLSIGGKRLRPVLTLLATDLFKGDLQESLSAALAIEIFHNFTLMHDDIMDQAPLRRGKATVHTKWNTNTAILSGDAMLIIAYQLLTESNPALLPQVLVVFNKMAQEVCEGQQLDMDFEQLSTVSEAEYIEMIRLKTSVLLGAALEIGAILGGASPTDQEQIRSFGVNMGIAFQLQDDILDVYGDPDKFGKQVGGDILENKKTLLLIKALELAKGQDLEELRHQLQGMMEDSSGKVRIVTELYDKLEIRRIAEEVKMRYAEKAYQALKAIQVPNDQKNTLKAFSETLLIREH